MSDVRPVVFVIDDDPSVRNGLDALLRSVALKVLSFSSADEFLRMVRPDAPSCIVLDVRLPDQSGLDLQRELAKSGAHPPIIFMSAHADVPMSVEAMKAGAIEFLTKPFRDQQFLDAIQVAIARDKVRRRDASVLAALQQRLQSLTSREREVMALVVSGRSNKEAALELDLTEVTVKVHRAQVMRKMRAVSLPDLVRMGDKLGIGIPASDSYPIV